MVFLKRFSGVRDGGWGLAELFFIDESIERGKGKDCNINLGINEWASNKILLKPSLQMSTGPVDRNV